MPLLEWLRDKVSDRKLRLFACACCRHIWSHLGDDSRRAVAAAELFADDQLSKQELQTAFALIAGVVQTERDNPAYHSTNGGIGGPATAAYAAAFVGLGGYGAADGVAACVVRTAISSGNDETTEKAGQAGFLREIVGPLPFRALALRPALLAWNDGTVVKLARGIYDERAFERMPILADALEDAGCADADILNHLRQPGGHVRGCWAVDHILGKC
jgi:hypothetical protein